MAIDIQILRVPLIFIFDAPESRTGKIFERATGGLVPTVIGSIADSKFLFPALSAVGTALAKIPGVGEAGARLGTLKNKVIIPMSVNPNSIEISKKANVVKTLTKRGIVSQFYQADPDNVKFSGSAGGQKSFLILSQIDTMLKTIETGTRNLVTMVYKFGGIYKGYFDNFNITASADRPNIFNYSFDFQFLDRNHFRLFQLAIRPSVLNEAIHNPGKVFEENLKISASELINTTGISVRKI